MYWVNAFLLLSSLAATATEDATFHLNILHINDMHSRFTGIGRLFEPCESGPSCYGGFARVNGVAKEIYDQDPNHTLFLNAGDNFQGSALFTTFKSDVVLDFLNSMPFDAMSLGNHEFDAGVDELNKFLRHIQIPNVCANIDLKKEIELVNGTSMTEWIMATRSGVKIGIVGYVTPDTRFTSKSENVVFLNMVDSVRKAAQDARASGAQIIIALGHGGYVVDQRIAAQVEEVDIVVGGHSHTFLYSGTPPDIDDTPLGPYPTTVTQKSGKMVPVVQAFKYTKYLGNLTVEFDGNFNIIRAVGNPILLSPDKPQDPTIVAKLDKWLEKLEEFIPANEVVTNFLSAAPLGDCLFKECELGNIVADALLLAAHEMGHPNCTIGVYNGGGIRSAIAAGNLTTTGLLDVFPFANTVMLVEMSGRYIIEMLEEGVRWYNLSRKWPKGGFLQVTGMRVAYDISKPAGQKVSSVLVRNSDSGENVELQPDKRYLVAFTEYLYRGGDNYTMFKEHPFKTYPLNISDYSAVQMYLSHQPTYEPYLDGRISFVDHTSGNDSPGTPVTERITIFISVATSMWVTWRFKS